MYHIVYFFKKKKIRPKNLIHLEYCEIILSLSCVLVINSLNDSPHPTKNNKVSSQIQIIKSPLKYLFVCTICQRQFFYGVIGH